MYQHLKSLAVFVAVAECRAFNRAAKQLGLQPSVVSHHIRKLESHLGVALLYRTTRKVALSAQGEILYQSVRELYSGCEQSMALLSDNDQPPSGKLSIAVPQFIPCPRLQQALWHFIASYPQIQVRLNYADQLSALPDADIDIALRIGQQRDSSLRSVKLSEVRHILVAAPDLIGQPISTISQVSQLPFIGLSCHSLRDLTLHSQTQEKILKRPHLRLEVDSINAALAAAIAGIGAADLPPTLCQQALDSGQLIELLPQWQLPVLPISATWSGEARRNSLIRHFLAHIQQSLSDHKC